MATSIQVVHGRSQLFNDLDVIALICLMTERVASVETSYVQLNSFITEWNEALMNYGPGTIDLKFDELVASSAAFHQFTSLIDNIYDEMKRIDMHVLTSTLNARCRAPGVHFANYRGGLLTRMIDEVRSLLQYDPSAT